MSDDVQYLLMSLETKEWKVLVSGDEFWRYFKEKYPDLSPDDELGMEITLDDSLVWQVSPFKPSYLRIVVQQGLLLRIIFPKGVHVSEVEVREYMVRLHRA